MPEHRCERWPTSSARARLVGSLPNGARRKPIQLSGSFEYLNSPNFLPFKIERFDWWVRFTSHFDNNSPTASSPPPANNSRNLAYSFRGLDLGVIKVWSNLSIIDRAKSFFEKNADLEREQSATVLSRTAASLNGSCYTMCITHKCVLNSLVRSDRRTAQEPKRRRSIDRCQGDRRLPPSFEHLSIFSTSRLPVWSVYHSRRKSRNINRKSQLVWPACSPASGLKSAHSKFD